ncbi:AAA family ATPase [Polyangium aurulentum]|uniref:AAA family ATPase n=1 Tax=Polyangium aurulentum TaxID=2567896 RepID=UPI0010AE0EB0|nr:AAA family ATPase [Polyangium aurulentum]UQA58423.1 AAA family ATPase [Polyangium aurulentum]
MTRLEEVTITEELERTPASRLFRGHRDRDRVPVRVKVLRTEFNRVADVASFKHDYERLSRLEAPGVVRVDGFEQTSDGMAVVLAEVEGEPLSTRARRPLGARELLDLAVPLTEALGAIHAAGVVHRGLTPASVIVDASGRPTIASFGVDATLTRENDALYEPQFVAETLPYFAPEQTGRMNRGVDERADLYSLGVLLYTLSTGQPPFRSEDPMELIHAHLALAPEPPSKLAGDVPRPLEAIVMKLLEKNAEDRYQSAAALLADLKECRQRLRADGGIDDFPIGAQHERGRLELRSKLYGREKDVAQLVGSFERVLGGAREIALVSGYSGVGKSSLVAEMLKPLARARGYYIAGKYDQLNREAPYSAILQAFDGLVRTILCESERRVRAWKEALIAALGANAQVVCEVLPSLAHVLGSLPPAPALGPVEAQNRFSLAIRRFISVFARRAHPLVLFLDDLQWADTASLRLLTTILLDDDIEALFFTGAYRDNEVNAAHPLRTALADLKKGGLELREIVLGPLRLEHVKELLADGLRAPSPEGAAEIVLQKTGGNPFFVRQLLRSLHESGVIQPGPGGSFRWSSLDAIAARPDMASVVDLMIGALRHLPVATQEALELGAAIGSPFELGTLSTVVECSPEEAYCRLAPAVEAGLLSRAGERYRFAHDKIQEAAYSMLAEAERTASHLRIGRLLSKRADAQSLFDAAGHLNSARELLLDVDERLALCRMNLAAAERAEGSAAFSAALRYLEHGMALLPETAWEEHYALSLRYFMKKGEMEVLCERHAQALETLGAAFDHARDRLDRTRVRRLRMNAYILKNDLPAALDEGIAALEPFGILLSRTPSSEESNAELDATLAALEGRPIESLIDLPLLDDPEIVALQDVIEDMLTPCYFVSPNNYEITVAKMVQHALGHGLSKHTIYSFVNFGMFLCVRGDIDRGYQFGQLAVRVSERYPDKKSEAMLCNMWGAFVQHWKEPYSRYKENFPRGVHAGLETGQYVWAFYNATNIPTNSLLRGASLSEVLAEATALLPVCKLDVSGGFTWIARAAAQIAQNLSSPSERGDKLVGEWIDIDVIRSGASAMGNRATVFFTDNMTILHDVFQGRYAEAAEIALRAEHDNPSVVSWHVSVVYHFYGPLALLLASDDASPEVRARNLALAEASSEKLARWAEHCPENHRHRSLLLRAEIARVRGDRMAAIDLYDEGIAAASAGRFVQDEALGNELCARYYLRLGKTKVARTYLNEAHALYGLWGAGAATSRLEKSFLSLLPRGPKSSQSGSPSDGRAPAQALDVHATIKAMHAISSEVVLSRLLESLLRIAIESAGATRGVLILRENDDLLIQAEEDIQRGKSALLEGVHLDSREDLSKGIVHYVARTGENVVLGDAERAEQFSGDPWLSTGKARSLLAAPVGKRGRVVGVLYLENELAAFAFTPERVELLRMLSTQMAISIENALLYASLERKVQDRTAALEKAHAEIVTLSDEQQRSQAEMLAQSQSLIERQKELIRALSTPILQVWDGVLALPLIGSLDGQRAADITERLLARVASSGTRHAIVDVTGVDTLDGQAAELLVRIGRAVQLLGARAMITGLHANAARTLVSHCVDLQGIETRANLRDGLRLCLRRLG